MSLLHEAQQTRTSALRISWSPTVLRSRHRFMIAKGSYQLSLLHEAKPAKNTAIAASVAVFVQSQVFSNASSHKRLCFSHGQFCLEARTIVPWRHEGLCPEAANDLEPRLRLVPCRHERFRFVPYRHERLCLIATNDYGLCLVATNDCALSPRTIVP